MEAGIATISIFWRSAAEGSVRQSSGFSQVVSTMLRSWNGYMLNITSLSQRNATEPWGKSIVKSACALLNLLVLRSVPPAWSTFMSTVDKLSEASTTRYCAIGFPQICGRTERREDSMSTTRNRAGLKKGTEALLVLPIGKAAFKHVIFSIFTEVVCRT